MCTPASQFTTLWLWARVVVQWLMWVVVSSQCELGSDCPGTRLHSQQTQVQLRPHPALFEVHSKWQVRSQAAVALNSH